MNNKKGILRSESLKMIVAIAGIVFLISLGVSLYGIFTKTSEINQAKNSISEIESKINYMEEKKINEADILISKPKSWYFISWPLEKKTLIPSKCIKNCICICPKKDLETCGKEGVCVELKKPAFILDSDGENKESYEIEGLFSLKINFIEDTKIEFTISE